MLTRAVQREALTPLPLAADVAPTLVALLILRVHVQHAILSPLTRVSIRIFAHLVFPLSLLTLHIGGHELGQLPKNSPFGARYVLLLIALPVQTINRLLQPFQGRPTTLIALLLAVLLLLLFAQPEKVCDVVRFSNLGQA